MLKKPFEFHAAQPGLAEGWHITDSDGVVIFSQHEPLPLELAREICAQLEDHQRAQASHRDLERAWHELLRERDGARLELAIEKRRLRREEISCRELQNLKHALLCEVEALRKTGNAFRNKQRAWNNKLRANVCAGGVMFYTIICLAFMAAAISKGEAAIACVIVLVGIFGVRGFAQARKSFLP